ncbi:MAG: metallophosphoesterase [Spirochaetota bacterium]|nr:metallophosphoesterase [Spirochaetota bacterium]
MKIFALSDIHIDYEENHKWLYSLSEYDYKDDILILAGDITDIIPSLSKAFEALKLKFHEVMYLPGNHDLWTYRNNIKNSIDKFNIIKKIANDYGINMKPAKFDSVSIIPLYGWFDFSFGQPSKELLHIWLDFTACKWPYDFDETKITHYFISINEEFLQTKNDFIITYSHFLPRIDLMPIYIPPSKRLLYPVLGTTLLEEQINVLDSQIHIYGHSHVNMHVNKDNRIYINNAFGYPSETRITAKELLCVFEL